MSRLSFLVLVTVSLQLNANKQIDDLPKTPVYSRWQTHLPYHHDQGFFLSASIGPEWVQSIQKPSASGIRFGGDISVGWVPWENIALHVTGWGGFLEQASFFAVGPGVTGFLGNDFALSGSFGLAFVQNISLSNDIPFSEKALALQFKGAKYWWTSENTSLGVAIVVGVYGFSPFSGRVNTVGWQAGPRLEFLFN